MTRPEKLTVSAPAQVDAAPARSAPPGFGPAAVLALQRSAGNAAVTALLARAPAWDPQPLVSTLRQAIDQVRVRDRWTPVDGMHATARHIDVPAVIGALDGLTPQQIQLVKIGYQAEALTTLENDLFGLGRSHTPASLTDEEAERIRALLRGTAQREGEAAPAARLDALAAELHGLAAGKLGQPERERMMALYRAHGTEMEAAYQTRYGHAPADDVRGKLAARQLLRLDALRAGDVERADAYALEDTQAAMTALGDSHLPEVAIRYRRAELTADAAAIQTQQALSGGRGIEALARRLVELEARRQTDTEQVEELLHQLHALALRDTGDDPAGLPALATRYVGLFGVMYDGLRPPGGRSWAAIVASSKHEDMLRATIAAGGRLDPVDELHFAIEARDAAAIRRVLDAHASHAQMVELNARYLGHFHVDLRHAVFGAAGIAVALGPDLPLVTAELPVHGHDAAAVLEALETPRENGADEVRWIVESAEREVQAVKAGSGLAGSVLDAETERMMMVTLAHMRQLADRWQDEHRRQDKHAGETLAELRGARARLRVDATGYEGDLERFRGQVRGALTLAVQAALTLVPGVGEGIVGFLATSVVNTTASTLANLVIQGDKYDLDMLYDDVVGGLAGALGSKLGEGALGLAAGGRAARRELIDLAAKQITAETAERAIAIAKAAGRTSKLLQQEGRVANLLAAARAGARQAGGIGGGLVGTSVATGKDQVTLENALQGVGLAAFGHGFGHADPRVVTDDKMAAGDAKVHYEAGRPGEVEDVHVRVAPGTRPDVVAEHVATARAVQRFKGLSGVLNRLYEQARGFFTGEHAALPGTHAFDVQAEIQKLQRSVANSLRAIAEGKPGMEAEVKTLADQIDYYSAQMAEIEANPARGSEPGRGWIAALSPESFEPVKRGPSFRRRMEGNRPDVKEHFAAADAEHEGTGPAPSARFDDALRGLERAGLKAPGRAAIRGLFKPARRNKPLSRTGFDDALEKVEQLAAEIAANEHIVTVEGLTSRYDELFKIGGDVVAAYRRGETIEGAPIRNPGDPKLAEAMQAMYQAFLDFNAKPTADPVERLMALGEVQQRIVDAMEALRAHDPTFSATVEPVGDVEPSDLVAGLQEQEIAVTATGRVSEPLFRQGFEKQLRSAGKLAGLKSGFRERLAQLLARYHLAHLIGPGFGGELREGIMLAPPDMNLGAQNDGVETFIRWAKEAGARLTLTAKATGRRLMVPLDGGGTAHVDVLTRVEYRIKIDGYDPELVVDITVSDPPNGRATVEHSDVPADAPGAAELLKRIRRQPAGR